jgi:hypothetical protein
MLTIPQSPTYNHNIRLEGHEFFRKPKALLAAVAGHTRIDHGYAQVSFKYLRPYTLMLHTPTKGR